MSAGSSILQKWPGETYTQLQMKTMIYLKTVFYSSKTTFSQTAQDLFQFSEHHQKSVTGNFLWLFEGYLSKFVSF